MKKIITTLKAPAPIGPYNQAIMVNDTLYLSGQIGLDPHSMKVVNGGVKEETKQVMKNLKAVLEAADMTFENVIKSSIFLINMSDFGKVNEIYGSYFSNETAPARGDDSCKDTTKKCKSRNINVSN